MLGYWKDRSNRFGGPTRMTCDVLSILITTIALESTFSIGSDVLRKYKTSCLMKQFQLSYAHVIGYLVLLVGLTFLLKVYNEAFSLYLYTYTNFIYT